LEAGTTWIPSRLTAAVDDEEENRMQRFQFGLRQSAESVDDNRSRYVPSSVYSAGGPGPVEDSSAVGQPQPFMSGGLRGPFEEQTPRFAPVSQLNCTASIGT